jgi:HlyD family secretion protein
MQNAPVKNAESPSEKKGKHLSGKKKLFIAGALLLVAIIAYFFFHASESNTGKLRVSGRIEGYETNVGAKIGGRVDTITVREGNFIHRGQLLVQISDDDIQAQLRAAKQRKDKAEEQVEESRYQIQVIKSQIEEAKYRLSQSAETSPAQIRQQEENVSQSRAQLANAEAKLSEALANRQLAALRKERYGFLVKRGAVTKDESDQQDTNYDTTSALVVSNQAAVEAARKAVYAAEDLLKQVKSVRFDPSIRNQELLGFGKQMLQANHSLTAAQHEAKAAQADAEQIKANIAYLKILSPIDGVVTARVVEPGAVVVPGQTLLSLINLDTVYLRAYVPEEFIGKVRVGQQANIFLDSDTQKALSSQVIEVDPEGSFTPENIYFKNDRVRQVFGIKIALYHPGGYAKPGMPADADILLTESAKAR